MENKASTNLHGYVSVSRQTNDSHVSLFIHSIHKETSLKVHHALIRILFMLLSGSKI